MKKAIISPLCSAFVIPGLGQILNQHIKKGLLLLFIIFGLFVATLIQLYRILTALIKEAPLSTLGPEGIINSFRATHPVGLYWIAGIFALLWFYSVIDAWFYGHKLDKLEKDITR
ncbi:MAG: hypothetical protein JRH08_02530 [Deltaproteobacteria bacterium]|nr:hypothetical protein [Deltaproteobacteria bacterium]MBW1928390.1 hypothetical protein [Deltaproteobacteria bacterium]MBW2023811.1 hypothetical protein [Deltaproteobacteria bacterium]MBW2124576.1 hypothetical protein [Deltaproteobacteria bacterium]RLB19263.1 MAG: hypothetical protein DRG63_01155 [Deltaproteobacteria bacterium]